MATESGYSNQKKLGTSQFKTVQQLGSGKHGTATAPKSLYEIAAPAAIVAVTSILGNDGQVKFWNVELTAHGAAVDNVLRLKSGALKNFEFDIVQIIDVDNFYILPISDSAPLAGVTAAVMGWVTPTSDEDGNVVFSPGPTQFVQEGSTVQVTQDDGVYANNKPLPTALYYVKDGVAVPVIRDTVTPSQNSPIPVEIIAVDGTNINITAGDINVQLSSEGVNFDSVRLGDGSGFYLAINADGSVNVVDADSLAELEAINLKLDDQATAAKQDLAQASLTSIDTKVTGLSTAAHQVTAQTSLTSIDGKLTGKATEAKQDALIAKLPSSIGQKVAADSLSVVIASGSSLPITSTTLATEAKQDDIIDQLELVVAEVEAIADKLPSTIGQKLPADSLSVVLATGTSISATVSGGATEAKQDVQITGIADINTELDNINAKFGSLGQKPSAGSAPVVLSADQELILTAIKTAVETTSAPRAGTVTSAQITVGTAAVRATVSGGAPSAARKKLMIKPSKNNTGNIYLGASGVTTANGLEIIGPDRLEFELDSADYYLISDVAGQTVEILEKV